MPNLPPLKPNTPEVSPVLTSAEAALRLSVTTRWVQYLAARKTIKTQTVRPRCVGPGRGGVQYRIPACEIDQYAELRRSFRPSAATALPAHTFSSDSMGEKRKAVPAEPSPVTREGVAHEDTPAHSPVPARPSARRGADRFALPAPAAKSSRTDESSANPKTRANKSPVTRKGVARKGVTREGAPRTESPWVGLTESQRALAVKDAALIKEWQSFITAFAEENPGTDNLKTAATDAFISEKAAQGIRLSKSTLYRKYAKYRENGTAGLADTRGRHGKHPSAIPPLVRQIFLDFYLTENKRGVPLCINLTTAAIRRDHPDEAKDLLPLADTSTFNKMIKTLNPAQVCLAREGEFIFNSKYAPSVTRTTKDLNPNDIWCGDNYKIDIMSNIAGSPRRVYLTMFSDVKTMMPMGFCVTETPSADATLLALKMGCLEYGKPRAVYVDNGREFVTNDIGGRGFRKTDVSVAIAPENTILGELGIEMTNAIPKNARAKIVERFFKTVKEHFCKLHPAYTGGTVREKPEKLKALMKTPEKLPTPEELSEQLYIYLYGAFANRPSNAKGLNGQSPRQYYEKLTAQKDFARRDITPDEAALMFLRRKGSIKMRRFTIRFMYQDAPLEYDARADIFLPYEGRDLIIHYDPTDMRQIRVHDAEGRFIGEAPLKTRLGYNATGDEISEQMRINRRLVKQIKYVNQHIKESEDTALSLSMQTAYDALSAEDRARLDRWASPSIRLQEPKTYTTPDTEPDTDPRGAITESPAPEQTPVFLSQEGLTALRKERELYDKASNW